MCAQSGGGISATAVCAGRLTVFLIYFFVLSLAVNVGLFPLRAASSALSAAQAHSWVRPHVHTHSVTIT